MAWRRIGRFWAFGDAMPELVILADSIFQVRGGRGWADAAPMVQWVLSNTLGMKTLIMAYPGARVARGDYAAMAAAVAGLGAASVLVLSMGNDLYGKATIDASAIGRGLLHLRTILPNIVFVYGGSAAVWGYQDEDYDEHVSSVCALLACKSGAVELRGAITMDAIGHLSVESVPQLCTAVLHWARASMRPRARL